MYLLFVGAYARLLVKKYESSTLDATEHARLVKACIELRMQTYNTKVRISSAPFCHRLHLCPPPLHRPLPVTGDRLPSCVQVRLPSVRGGSFAHTDWDWTKAGADEPAVQGFVASTPSHDVSGRRLWCTRFVDLVSLSTGGHAVSALPWRSSSVLVSPYKWVCSCVCLLHQDTPACKQKMASLRKASTPYVVPRVDATSFGPGSIDAPDFIKWDIHGTQGPAMAAGGLCIFKHTTAHEFTQDAIQLPSAGMVPAALTRRALYPMFTMPVLHGHPHQSVPEVVRAERRWDVNPQHLLLLHTVAGCVAEWLRGVCSSLGLGRWRRVHRQSDGRTPIPGMHKITRPAAVLKPYYQHSPWVHHSYSNSAWLAPWNGARHRASSRG